jgi:hypothetical protein
MRRLIVAAALALATAAPAVAIPGQSLSDFDRWSHGNATLHGIAGESALDGSISYASTFQAGNTTAQFRAISDIGETRIATESIVYAAPDDYRLDQHRETAGRLLSAVYGREVADDFRDAPVALTGSGDLPTVAYRGKSFGYELTGARATVRALADFDVDLICIRANDCPVGDQAVQSSTRKT